MQPKARKGAAGGSSKKAASVPATDDEIREKYLERAIRELNDLGRELAVCRDCPRGNVMPVQGSGHPQADIFMLKAAPTPAEIEDNDALDYDRIAFVFDRHRFGRLRQLIDRLNDIAGLPETAEIPEPMTEEQAERPWQTVSRLGSIRPRPTRIGGCAISCQTS